MDFHTKKILVLALGLALLCIPSWSLAQNVIVTTHSTCSGQNNGAIELEFDTQLSLDYPFPWDAEWENDLTGAFDTLTISASSVILDQLEAGTHEIIIQLDDVCVLEVFEEVTENTNCCPDCHPIDASVNNGSIHVNIECEESGGFNYLWSDGGTGNPRTGLEAGTYCVTATSSNGCEQLGCWEVTSICSPPIALSDLNVKVTHSCSAAPMSGAIELIEPIAQGLFYFWTGPNNYSSSGTTISNLTPGEYCLSIFDDLFNMNCAYAEGCFTVEADGDQCCQDCYPLEANVGEGSIQVSLECLETGNFTYQWSDGETGNIRRELDPGTYCVTVTSSSGCSFSGCWEVEASCPEVIILSEQHVDITCSSEGNGSIVLNNTALVWTGAIPIWTGPNGCINSGDGIFNLAPGEYCLSIEYIFGGYCPLAEGCFTLSNSLEIELATIPTCENMQVGSIVANVVSGTPPYSYLWSNGATTSNIGGLAGGQTYTVTVTDTNGCEAIEEAEILEGSIKVGAIVTNADCSQNNGTITVTTVGIVPTLPFTYLWNDGATSAVRENLAPGEYCVTLTDSKGCTGNNCFDIVSDQIQVGLVQFSNNLFCSDDGGCNGSIAIEGISGTPPYSYQWSSGGTNTAIANNLCEGNYTVTVTDSESCTGTFTTSICCCNGDPQDNSRRLNEFDCYPDGPAIISIANVDFDPIENGEPGYIHLTVEAQSSLPIIYTWEKDGFFYSNEEDIDNLSVGEYCVTITDGCELTSYCREIVDCGTYDINISGTPTVACSGHAQGNVGVISPNVMGGQIPYKYKWSSGQTTLSLEGLSPGQYILTVTDFHGCTQSQLFIVQNAMTTRPECIIFCGDVPIENLGPLEPRTNPNDCAFVDMTCVGDGLIIGDPIEVGTFIHFDRLSCILTTRNNATNDVCPGTTHDGNKSSCCVFGGITNVFGDTEIFNCDIEYCFFPTLDQSIIVSVDDYEDPVVLFDWDDWDPPQCQVQIYNNCIDPVNPQVNEFVNGDCDFIGIDDVPCSAVGLIPDGLYSGDLGFELQVAGFFAECESIFSEFLSESNDIPANAISSQEVNPLPKFTDVTSVINALVAERGMQVFPNPTNGQFTLSFSSKLRGEATLRILSADGKEKARLGKTAIDGLNNWLVQNLGLADGLYFLILETPDGRLQKTKLVFSNGGAKRLGN